MPGVPLAAPEREHRNVGILDAEKPQRQRSFGFGHRLHARGRFGTQANSVSAPGWAGGIDGTGSTTVPRCPN
jgi:hypothetical protein